MINNCLRKWDITKEANFYFAYQNIKFYLFTFAINFDRLSKECGDQKFCEEF